jgi:hypothetical protein
MTRNKIGICLDLMQRVITAALLVFFYLDYIWKGGAGITFFVCVYIIWLATIFISSLIGSLEEKKSGMVV